MRNSTRLTLAAITLLGGATLANAQTTTDPGAPHPGMSPPAATPGMPMMGMDKMRPGGAGPGMSQGGMPQRGMPMMGMMHGMMHGGPGMGGMGRGMQPFEHIEGRVAFLKAELAITDAQMPQWNDYAAAMRAGAASMKDAMAKIAQAGMPTVGPERAEAMIQMMTARLDTMKSRLAAGKALYAVLTDAQKKTADELMWGRMGRM